MALNLEKPLLLSGDLYLSEGSYGSYTSRIGPIETDAFTVQLASSTVEQKSKANATYGQTRSSIVLPDNTTLAMTFMDAGAADPLTLILMGTKSAITASAGTVTGESVTLVLDTWVALAQRNLTPGSFTLTGKTEGTDFDVNYRRGWVMALNAGAAGAKTVGYAHGADSGSRVAVATQSQIIRRVELDGVNLHDNKPVFVEMYRVKLRSEAQLDLKGNQHVTAGITGVCETPTGITYPGYIDLFD